MIRAGVVVSVVSLLTACRAGDSSLFVEVSSAAPITGVDHFRIEVSNHGQRSAPIDLILSGRPVSIPPSRSFSLVFASDRQGDVAVTVTAVDGSQQPLAAGSGTTTITAGQAAQLNIQLGRDVVMGMDGGADGSFDGNMTTTDASFTGPSDSLTTDAPLALDGSIDGAPIDARVVDGVLLDASAIDAVMTPDLAPLKVERVCTKEGWCWQNPLPQGSRILDSWAASPTDVWMVGGFERGLVIHWDGVGSGRIDHWDGTAWSPSAMGLSPLYGVFGSGPNDVWAVGNTGAIYHFSGGSWTPIPLGTMDDLVSVWASGPSDAYAVGRDNAFHWDGSTWTLITASLPAIGNARYFKVWGTGAKDVWIVGSGGMANHWDGTTWSAPATFASKTILYTLSGTGPKDVWAAGEGGTILHWDGAVWSTRTSGPVDDLNGAVIIAADEQWAVGRAGRILHGNGVSWSVVDSGRTDLLLGVWGASKNDVWAVGQDATGGGSTALCLHWNGTAWSPVAAPSGVSYLKAVHGTAANDVWAVGGAGTIIHWNGSAWSLVPSNTTITLNSVWAGAPDKAWAVGNQVLATWNAGGWKAQGTNGSNILGVWGVDQNNVFVAGQNFQGGYVAPIVAGSIVPEVHYPQLNSMVAISGTAIDDISALTNDDRIAHWDGQMWTMTLTGADPYTNTLNWLAARAGVGTIAFGRGGAILAH